MVTGRMCSLPPSTTITFVTPGGKLAIQPAALIDMVDVGTSATIGTDCSSLNGATLPSNYFYAVSSTSVSASENSNGTTTNLSASGTLNGFSQASLSGTISIPSTPGYIDIGGTTFQVYGSTADGHNLVLGPTNVTGSGPFFVLSDTGQPPQSAIVFNSNNPYTAPAPVCFAAGTLILTIAGEVPVESLAVGDTVVTASGGQRPIRWVGGTRVHVAAATRASDVMPIEFKCGALGENVPSRDLVVSPGHRMLLDGMLFQAESLINDLTIVRKPVAAIDYHHVELDEPDALLANGAAAESFVDVGNRSGFSTAIGLPSAAALIDGDPLTETFAPNIKHGPILATIRAMLVERALTMGWSRAIDRSMTLQVDGARVGAAVSVGDRHWFILPEASGEIVLLSAAAVCSAIKPELSDDRRLGVQIVAVVADGRDVQLYSPEFAGGFHDCEEDGERLFRWTDGAATLRLRKPARIVEILVGRGAELIVADHLETRTAIAA